MPETLEDLRRSLKEERRRKQLSSTPSTNTSMESYEDPSFNFCPQVARTPGYAERRRLRKEEQDLKEGLCLLEQAFGTTTDSSKELKKSKETTTKNSTEVSNIRVEHEMENNKAEKPRVIRSLCSWNSKNDEDGSSEDDIVAIAKHLEHRKKLEEEASRRKVAREEKKLQETKEIPARAVRSLFGPYQNEEDDIVAIAKSLEEKRKQQKKIQLDNMSNTKEHIGLSISKDDEAVSSSPKPRKKMTKNHPLYHRNRHLQYSSDESSTESGVALRPYSKTRIDDDQALWSDDSDLENREDPERATITSKPKRQRATLVEVNGSILRASVQLEQEDVDRLIPQFDNPRLGPPGPLVEFNLSNENDSNNQLASSLKYNNDKKDNYYTVPASIRRYLQDYQLEGIRFLYNAVVNEHKGVILGDDMGMGKTVQVIAFLAALLGKTGTGQDKVKNLQRIVLYEEEIARHQNAEDRAILKGTISKISQLSAPLSDEMKALMPEKWSPILLVCPPSVIQNWRNELDVWGHFAVEVFQDKDRLVALDRIKGGVSDILLCGRALFSQEQSFQQLMQFPWKLVVVDEYHEFKSKRSKAWECLYELKLRHKFQIVGLTGTAMQNNHEELWNLIYLVQPGLLGTWSDFRQNYVQPLKLARTKDAKGDVIELGKRRQEELINALKGVYLSRKKKDYLKGSLTEKDEKVVFCELTDVQKEIYRNIMSLPDYFLLRMANTPCDCGVNKAFFVNYQSLKTKKERLEYQRRHKKEIVPRKDCCYKIPWNSLRGQPGEPDIDPKAAIWKAQHPNDEPCINAQSGKIGCPTCILLPALQKLYKVSSHASLIQADKRPDKCDSESDRSKMEKKLAFAKVAITPEILERIPGMTYFREDNSIMDDHLRLSGKMQVLDSCLEIFNRRNDRALIFSHSTATLDMIQNYVMAKGYSFLRLDGSTITRRRQVLIDKFQRDKSIFLFLISTKAGGLGINLTAANKVIVYDVSWNPSYDEQAQDRAFRIGQKRDVEVIRLVSQGTVEELMYARQIYKVHLTKQSLGDGAIETGAQPRIFRGVSGDKRRRGELFGLENLLKFKDGSFMAEMFNASPKNLHPNSKKGFDGTDHNIQSASAISEALAGVGEDRVFNFGQSEEIPSTSTDCNLHQVTLLQNEEIDDDFSLDLPAIPHDAFMRNGSGEVVLPGDGSLDEVMGEASQLVANVCDLAIVNFSTFDQSKVEDEIDQKNQKVLKTTANNLKNNRLLNANSANRILLTIDEVASSNVNPDIGSHSPENCHSLDTIQKKMNDVLDDELDEFDSSEWNENETQPLPSCTFENKSQPLSKTTISCNENQISVSFNDTIATSYKSNKQIDKRTLGPIETKNATDSFFLPFSTNERGSLKENELKTYGEAVQSAQAAKSESIIDASSIIENKKDSTFILMGQSVSAKPASTSLYIPLYTRNKKKNK